MKKRFLVMAMAGLALAGCVSEDVSDVKQKDEKKALIAFDTPVLYNNSESRAKVYGEIGSHTYDGSTVTYSYPREEEFQIYAIEYGDGNSFTSWEVQDVTTTAGFNDTSIKWAGIGIDGWAPTDGLGNYYYWPSGKKMAFAACSPADLEFDETDNVERTYGKTGLSITNFSIPVREDGDYYDLLFSTRVVDQTASNMSHSASYYSGIPIQFQHALSSIRFSLMNRTLATVRLTKIELWGVYSKANFTEGITKEDAAYVRATYNSDSNQYNNDGTVMPLWSEHASSIANSAPYIGFVGDIDFPYPNANYVSTISSYENENNSEGNECHQLLLLPQVLPDNATLRVHYIVGSQSHFKDVLLKNQLAYQDPNNTETSISESIDEWEIGKRYTYRLVYSDATQQQDMIYFAPSTDEWKDENIIVVNL